MTRFTHPKLLSVIDVFVGITVGDDVNDSFAFGSDSYLKLQEKIAQLDKLTQ